MSKSKKQLKAIIRKQAQFISVLMDNDLDVNLVIDKIKRILIKHQCN